MTDVHQSFSVPKSGLYPYLSNEEKDDNFTAIQMEEIFFLKKRGGRFYSNWMQTLTGDKKLNSINTFNSR